MSDEIPYGYCHCGCGQKTSPAAQGDTKRGYVKGEPMKYIVGHGNSKKRYTPEEKESMYRDRFFAKLPPPNENGCIIWSNSLTESGYGKYYNGKSIVKAHRYAYEIANGPIPKGMFCCHSCDTPACVNHEHIFLGTPKDNTADMTRKNRGNIGEKAHSAKLTESDVREIYHLYNTIGLLQRVIAERYGVNRQEISRIARRERWKHVNYGSE